ncbi:MAG: DUF6614 family protein [Ruegeria sp.]
MPRLLNQFDLKHGATIESFQQAWDAFVECLVNANLAVTSSPLNVRVAESGYDTDEMRSHTFMAVIEFRDQPQADAAWAAIEDRVEPLVGLHRNVISLVHDPVFTFWSEL